MPDDADGDAGLPLVLRSVAERVVHQLHLALGSRVAATHAAWKRRVLLVRSSGVPSSGCAKTRSSPSPYPVRSSHFFSSRTRRSDIGTERRVLRSDLPSPECSPRTHAFRTRMR